MRNLLAFAWIVLLATGLNSNLALPASAQTAESEHAQIIKLLNDLSNQVTVLKGEIGSTPAQLLVDQSQTNVKLEQLQAQIQQLVATVQQQQALIQQQQASIQTLHQALDLANNTEFQHYTALNSSLASQTNTLTDIQHREVGMCYMIETISPGNPYPSPELEVRGCNGTAWEAWFKNFIRQSIPYQN